MRRWRKRKKRQRKKRRKMVVKEEGGKVHDDYCFERRTRCGSRVFQMRDQIRDEQVRPRRSVAARHSSRDLWIKAQGRV